MTFFIAYENSDESPIAVPVENQTWGNLAQLSPYMVKLSIYANGREEVFAIQDKVQILHLLMKIRSAKKVTFICRHHPHVTRLLSRPIAL